jgi:hypothetical protein
LSNPAHRGQKKPVFGKSTARRNLVRKPSRVPPRRREPSYRRDDFKPNAVAGMTAILYAIFLLIVRWIIGLQPMHKKKTTGNAIECVRN